MQGSNKKNYWEADSNHRYIADFVHCPFDLTRAPQQVIVIVTVISFAFVEMTRTWTTTLEKIWDWVGIEPTTYHLGGRASVAPPVLLIGRLRPPSMIPDVRSSFY